MSDVTSISTSQEQSAGTNAPVTLGDPFDGAHERQLAAGTLLFEADSSAKSMYCVRKGQVRIYQIGPDDSARLAEILGPGEWFGTASIVDPGNRSYGTRAVVVTDAVIAEVPAERWLARLAESPALATQWVQRLAAKLEAARADAACLVFNDCNQRLVRALLHLSRTAAAAPHEEGVVLRITHQQLAQAVGAARETVSLALTQLRQRNLLRTGRNQLFFNPQTLERHQHRRREPAERMQEVEPQVA